MDIICIEKSYADDHTGAEFSVRYDRKPYLHNEEIIGYITLQHVGDIVIPITELNWLISSLQRIKKEI